MLQLSIQSQLFCPTLWFTCISAWPTEFQTLQKGHYDECIETNELLQKFVDFF